MKRVKLVLIIFFICVLTLILSFNISFLLPPKIKKKFPQINSGTRLQNIAKFCQNYRRRERINPNYFYYYKKKGSRHGLLWCKVPKAGSTTLTKLYLRLAGVHLVSEDDESVPQDLKVQNLNGNCTHGNTTPTYKVHKALREYYPKIPWKDLQGLVSFNSTKTIKFMVVRDPFERLVSAYRDKLENYQRDLTFRDGYYYENYGRFMIPAKEFNTTRVPTWSEFISYLLKTSVARFDEHWMPMSRLCSPCALNYNYLIKLEHFYHQIQRPLKRVGIDAPNIGWSHRTGSGTDRIVKKYFNNLTLIEIKKLYVKYKRDFQLFGYKPYKYFKLANK